MKAALLALCLLALSCGGAPKVDDERLIQDLDDWHWQIRASAAEELGRRGVESAAGPLGKALSDGSEEVRAAAAMSIGRLGARSEIDEIRRVIDQDEDDQVKVMALYALADLAAGETGTALLQDTNRLSDAMYDDSRRVKRAARRVLRKLIGHAAAEPYLREFANWEQEEPDEGPKSKPWLYERIEDRLALAPDGECSLTRTFTVRGERTAAIRKLEVTLPESFPDVDRVTDAEGNPLDFGIGWKDSEHQLTFDVPRIDKDATATFAFTARSRRPLFLSGRDEARLVYAPGPIDARVRHLRVELSLPAKDVRVIEPNDLRLGPRSPGEAAILERDGLEMDEVDDLALQVGVTASALKWPRTPPRRYTEAGDLALAAGVVAVILAGLTAAILRLRRKLGERSQRAILVAVLSTGAFLFLTPILIEDCLPYYAITRSAVLDGDLDRENEYTVFNQTQAYAPDHRAALDPVFGSFFRIPAFVAARWVTAGLNAVSSTYAPNGFSFPFLFFTALGDFLAMLLGCLACFSLVERRVGRPYALFAVLSIVGGTNLLLFTYGWTSSSFQPSFFLFAVFLDFWDRTRDERSPAGWLGAGVLLGLLGITRTLNLGFVLIPFLDWIHTALTRSRPEGARSLARHTGNGALLAAGIVLGFAPQLVLHRLADHTWWVDTYGVGTGRFTGLRDNLWGLFLGQSFPARFDGFLLAMPMFCLAFLGLIPLFRLDRRLGTTLIAALALQLFAIASYEVYWGYFEYGTPYLVPSSPILCLAMGSLMKAVHSRWRKLGPALLWGLAVPLFARNGWCMLQQLGSDLYSGWGSNPGDLRVLHSLLMLDRKLDGNVLRCSSEFGCLLRETVGALRSWDFGALLAALAWAASLAAAVFLTYTVWSRSGEWAARVPPRARARLFVSASAIAWVAIMGWLVALGAGTNLDYRDLTKRRIAKKAQLEIERIDPGRTFTLPLRLGSPIASVSVVTFLEDAADVPQGAQVATLELDASEKHEQFDLRAGVDTADFAVGRSESAAGRLHAAPMDRACLSWRVVDDSSRFYTARAFRTVLEVPDIGQSAVLKVTSTLERGKLAVVMVNVLEAKLPRDPARRRWLAERW